jgi:septal ring factor EnvC (AmiA/AmiB activator)
VAYAAPFRGYGYVLIIDHGRGWSTVITDLASLQVRPGQTVRRGAVVGRAGGNRPTLTVELRRDGRPIPFAQLIAG